jgi:hypothetical protein
MTFPLWRYGAYAFAIAATLCLAAANVAWAIALDEGVYRSVMIALSIAADVGAICALMAIFHYQAEGDAISVIAAAAIWACCGYAEVKGAEVWLKANSFVISAPAAKATEAQKAASAELTEETANLADIRKLLASERREVKLDSLRQREKEALARVEKLRPQTFTTAIEPARSQYVGNELTLAFALWLLSQLAWRMAVGRLHGQPRVAVRPRVERDQPSGRTVRPTVRPEVIDIHANDAGADMSADSQSIDVVHADTSTDSVRTDSGQQNGQPVRPALTVVPKDNFKEQVLTLSKAGFSVRQIADRMGCGRTKVQDVLKPKKQITTEGGA